MTKFAVGLLSFLFGTATVAAGSSEDLEYYLDTSPEVFTSFDHMKEGCETHTNEIEEEMCLTCVNCFELGCYASEPTKYKYKCKVFSCYDMVGCTDNIPPAPLTLKDLDDNCNAYEDESYKEECQQCVHCIGHDCFNVFGYSGKGNQFECEEDNCYDIHGCEKDIPLTRTKPDDVEKGCYMHKNTERRDHCKLCVKCFKHACYGNDAEEECEKLDCGSSDSCDGYGIVDFQSLRLGPLPTSTGALPISPTTQPPTSSPTVSPTLRPTTNPTRMPTPVPTKAPSTSPVSSPTAPPTKSPSARSTSSPTTAPIPKPTQVSEPTQRPATLPYEFNGNHATGHSYTGDGLLRTTTNPTLVPTSTSTRKPSLPPTTPSTLTPTSTSALQPMQSPTISPTPQPTVGPTPKPTRTPTPQPSSSPTTSPSTRPTPRPTQFPTKPPSREPTHVPSSLPTLLPTPLPTSGPTARATSFTTIKPTPKIDSVYEAEKNEGIPLTTGKACSNNSQCVSDVCRNGACMASPDCYPIKHEYGRPFDENSINIVFVGSAFDSTTHEVWRAQVNKTYEAFGGYNMFSKDIEQLNVFAVDPSDLNPSFCLFNCAGISRLLCCDIGTAKSLSSKCFPDGADLQTVVIHNDAKYGGAGYTFQNLATVSVHPQGSLVAIHELSHSLFELADEYSYGHGTSSDPNCAGTSDCSKWSDLIGNTPEGYSEVTCEPGCRNGNFYIGGSSFMEVLSNPVGAVNERYTCCTYLALTKSMPSYCDAFDFEENYLLHFCKSNDYQNYGQSNYDPDPLLAIPDLTNNEDSKYIHVSNPILVKVGLKGGAAILGERTGVPGPKGLYRRAEVLGDFISLSDAASKGVYSVIRVKVIYLTGKETLYFSKNTTIDVPSPQGETEEEQDDGVPRQITGEADVLRLVMDAEGRTIKKIRVRLMRTN